MAEQLALPRRSGGNRCNALGQNGILGTVLGMVAAQPMGLEQPGPDVITAPSGIRR